MDLLNNLALGFGVAFTLQNLLYAFGGAMLGTLIGVLPGLGPVATIAMLLPSIYALDATPALIMLAGIYYGAQYGGSTTAILINVPGESSSVVTAIDGYQMARQGRAGAALAAAGLGSFFAGCVGTIVIAAGHVNDVRLYRDLLSSGIHDYLLKPFGAARFAVAVSGVAGPDGGSADKPVGTVWLAFGVGDEVTAELAHFPGNRDEVRRQTVKAALEGLLRRAAAEIENQG